MTHAPLRWLAVPLAIAAVGLAAYLLWPSEEHRVRARVEALADSLGVPTGEPDLARLSRAARVREYFTEDVTVDFEAREDLFLRGREAVAGIVARPGPARAGVRIELSKLTITVDTTRRSADVRCEGRVVSRDPAADPPTLDARLVCLTLRRVDGAWLVSSARVLPRDDAIR